MEEVEPDHYAIRPLVRVNKQGTVYYETACGSGSLAVAYLTNSMTPHKNIVKVEQPSGSTYIVRLKRNTKIEIEADVKIVKKGTIRLQPDVHV